VKAAVLGSDAPAVLSSLSVAQELVDGRLTRIKVEKISMPRDLRAIWPRGSALRGPARDLVTLAAQDQPSAFEAPRQS
jgi:hypothetical protein